MSTAPKKLPIIKATIAEDLDSKVELTGIALVDRPAIMANFLAFRDEPQAPAWVALQDDERHIVTGPLMIADLPIYRKINGREFYVVYEAETIYKMVQKFFKKGYQSSVNFMHDGQPVEGITLFESFIVDEARGVAPVKGYDVPAGSWFGSFIVDNPEAWAMIKDGTFKGFSIEGLFTLEGLDDLPQVDDQEEQIAAARLERLKDILSQLAEEDI